MGLSDSGTTLSISVSYRVSAALSSGPSKRIDYVKFTNIMNAVNKLVRHAHWLVSLTLGGVFVAVPCLRLTRTFIGAHIDQRHCYQWRLALRCCCCLPAASG